jgi:hypothetical protein
VETFSKCENVNVLGDLLKIWLKERQINTLTKIDDR